MCVCVCVGGRGWGGRVKRKENTLTESISTGSGGGKSISPGGDNGATSFVVCSKEDSPTATGDDIIVIGEGLSLALPLSSSMSTCSCEENSSPPLNMSVRKKASFCSWSRLAATKI